eukprot:gene1963-1471_t
MNIDDYSTFQKIILFTDIGCCSIFLILSLIAFLSLSLRFARSIKKLTCFSSIFNFHSIIFISMTIYALLPTIITTITLIPIQDDVFLIYVTKAVYSIAYLKFLLMSIMLISMIYLWDSSITSLESEISDEQIINLIDAPPILPRKFFICSIILIVNSILMILQRFGTIIYFIIMIISTRNEFDLKNMFVFILMISKYFVDFVFCAIILIFHFEKTDLETISSVHLTDQDFENQHTMVGYDDIQGE